jgi:hypothetical protein
LPRHYQQSRFTYVLINSPIGSTILIMVLVATTLQLGYLAGVVSRHLASRRPLLAHSRVAAPQQFGGSRMLSDRYRGLNPLRQSPINPLRAPRFPQPGSTSHPLALFRPWNSHDSAKRSGPDLGGVWGRGPGPVLLGKSTSNVISRRTGSAGSLRPVSFREFRLAPVPELPANRLRRGSNKEQWPASQHPYAVS